MSIFFYINFFKLRRRTNQNVLEQLQQIDLLLFPFSPYREILYFNFNIYERSTQQIDFPPFLYGKGDAMSPLSIGDWREIIGD